MTKCHLKEAQNSCQLCKIAVNCAKQLSNAQNSCQLCKNSCQLRKTAVNCANKIILTSSNVICRIEKSVIWCCVCCDKVKNRKMELIWSRVGMLKHIVELWIFKFWQLGNFSIRFLMIESRSADEWNDTDNEKPSPNLIDKQTIKVNFSKLSKSTVEGHRFEFCCWVVCSRKTGSYKI